MIDESVIEQVRHATKIEEVIGRELTLKRKGDRYWGRCPFHSEKSASFSVSPGPGLYYCFGCGAGGDTVDFLRALHNWSFQETMAHLGSLVGIDVQVADPNLKRRLQARQSLGRVCDFAGSFYHGKLTTNGSPAREYMLGRGFTSSVLDIYQVGLAPAAWRTLTLEFERKGIDQQLGIDAGLLAMSDNGGVYDRFRGRVVFPIALPNGQVVGFGGRLLSGEGPKYLNTPEGPLYDKSSVLYGLNQALPAIRKSGRVITTEGYMDVLACCQAGLGETVAGCGTAVTAQHIKLLSRYAGQVVALFDQDEAGQAAAEKALPMYLAAGLDVLAPTLPDGIDPADLVERGESEMLVARINEATPLLSKTMVRISRRHSPGPAGRDSAARAAADLVRQLKGVTREQAGMEAAQALAIPWPAFRSLLGSTPKPKQKQQAKPAVDRMAAEVIWSLIHARDQVFEQVAAADPAWFDSDEERYVIGYLMNGSSPVEVLESIPDQSMRLVFLRLSQEVDRHPNPQRTVSVALARKELAHLQRRVASLRGAEAATLYRRRLELQRQLRT